MTKRRSKRGDYEIEDCGSFELSPEQEEKASRMIAEADAEDEALRVNFRWQKEPLEMVKKAAGFMGVPYQTYMKMVLYKQALADLNEHAATNSRLRSKTK